MPWGSFDVEVAYLPGAKVIEVFTLLWLWGTFGFMLPELQGTQVLCCLCYMEPKAYLA